MPPDNQVLLEAAFSGEEARRGIDTLVFDVEERMEALSAPHELRIEIAQAKRNLDVVLAQAREFQGTAEQATELRLRVDSAIAEVKRVTAAAASMGIQGGEAGRKIVAGLEPVTVAARQVRTEMDRAEAAIAKGGRGATLALSQAQEAALRLRAAIEAVQKTGSPIPPQMLAQLGEADRRFVALRTRLAEVKARQGDLNDDLRAGQTAVAGEVGAINDLTDVARLGGAGMADMAQQVLGFVGAAYAGYAAGSKLRDGVNGLLQLLGKGPGAFDRWIQGHFQMDQAADQLVRILNGEIDTTNELENQIRILDSAGIAHGHTIEEVGRVYAVFVGHQRDVKLALLEGVAAFNAWRIAQAGATPDEVKTGFEDADKALRGFIATGRKLSEIEDIMPGFTARVDDLQRSAHRLGPEVAESITVPLSNLLAEVKRLQAGGPGSMEGLGSAVERFANEATGFGEQLGSGFTASLARLRQQAQLAAAGKGSLADLRSAIKDTAGVANASSGLLDVGLLKKIDELREKLPAAASDFTKLGVATVQGLRDSGDEVRRYIDAVGGTGNATTEQAKVILDRIAQLRAGLATLPADQRQHVGELVTQLAVWESALHGTSVAVQQNADKVRAFASEVERGGSVTAEQAASIIKQIEAIRAQVALLPADQRAAVEASIADLSRLDAKYRALSGTILATFGIETPDALRKSAGEVLALRNAFGSLGDVTQQQAAKLIAEAKKVSDAIELQPAAQRAALADIKISMDQITATYAAAAVDQVKLAKETAAAEAESLKARRQAYDQFLQSVNKDIATLREDTAKLTAELQQAQTAKGGQGLPGSGAATQDVRALRSEFDQLSRTTILSDEQRKRMEELRVSLAGVREETGGVRAANERAVTENGVVLASYNDVTRVLDHVADTLKNNSELAKRLTDSERSYVQNLVERLGQARAEGDATGQMLDGIVTEITATFDRAKARGSALGDGLADAGAKGADGLAQAGAKAGSLEEALKGAGKEGAGLGQQLDAIAKFAKDHGADIKSLADNMSKLVEGTRAYVEVWRDGNPVLASTVDLCRALHECQSKGD